MNTLDILIIGGISLYIVLGFRDGIFKKFLGILGFWGGFVLAVKFMSPFSEVIAEWLDLSTEAALIVAFFAILLVAVISVNILYRWFGKSGSDTLQIRTRVAGALLGGAQGLIAVSLFLIMLRIFDEPSEEARKESTLYNKTVKIAPSVFDYSTQWMPASKAFYEEVKSKIDKFTLPR